MRRAFSIAAALAAIFAAGSAEAIAQAPTETVARGEAVVDGPALAGNTVVWATRNPDRSVSIRSGSVGGEPETVLRLPEPNRRTLDVTGLSASPEAVALTRGISKHRCQGDSCSVARLSSTALAGPLQGPFEPGALEPRCAGNAPYTEDVDLAGSVLMISQSVYCRRAWSARLVARDLSTGAETVLAQKADRAAYSQVAAAPGWVAWSTGDSDSGVQEIEVFDLSSPNLIYTVEVPFLADFDVQADGKLAVLQPVLRQGLGTARSDVTWYSPEEPSAHKLARTTDDSRLAIAGDQIVYESQRLSCGEIDLVLTDLDGNEQVLRHFDRERPLIAGRSLGFDGSRVAFAERARSGSSSERQVAVTTVPETRRRTGLPSGRERPSCRRSTPR